MSTGLPVELYSTAPVDIGFHPIEVVPVADDWPGMPILSVVDDQSTIMGSRQGNEVRGHWSTAPALVAAARLALDRLRTGHD